MAEKNTRGRASKVDLLPPDIKTRLAMMLRDKTFSQAEILAEINDLIRDCGLDESYCLSKTGLNRYASRMEQMGAKIRQSREIAEIWTKQFGEAPQSDIGKMLMEIVKNIAFETSLGLSENGQADPKSIALLSSAVQRLEQAESLSFKREQAIRKEVAQQAAETAEKVVAQAGLSAETVRTIKEQILGIV
ncbi:DUF3486 family protein [Mannheimia haemolytica]|uniref:DUF3486 family protein n=1 Tax=Mannheimia haemolytica TaxID=75985 RepID=UPI0001BCF7DD|nr:DUF3486 family protein [Mannheimia haemolytica]EEY08692.1 Mu-like phage gp27 [Mannheimia haemolytica serotype A2 str. OVINE]EEY13320.1 Mu-like phage gp27 [Mannheimia haemolytica serotype A2 str. BOVINE]MDW0723579.1 DUF3486 family protein [Mannheimia haemolytica]MDW0736610.1 DUF3486 family protein [Mannheimia haemolytica]TRC15193.1 DUF3486 family protein [Mannheimia haemolytica]